MTYPEALNFFDQSRMFGMKPGLDRMRRLAQRLGRPQESLHFIHLAGTNGKGSTAAFCESCLRASGYRVGLYTSPHLVSIRERIQIDRKPISEEAFAAGTKAVRRAMGDGEDREATFFEIMTAVALWHFAREEVDWVVWETGLGGRLDATNIVTPEVCIITNIGLDHQKYLGETLREIAEEKAGIIKRDVPVVSAVEIGDASEVIREKAKSEGCNLTLVQRDMKVEDLGLRGARQIARINGREFALGLMGSHQVYNAACAIEAMGMAAVRRRGGDPALMSAATQVVSEEVLARGLESVVWPGRFEILSEKPLIVLDGGHNPAGIRRLVETWRRFLSAKFNSPERNCDGRAHLVFAVSADKDIAEMAELLRPLARRVSLVRLSHERSAEPALLAPSFAGLSVTCYDSVPAVWHDLASAQPEEVILITGSLFLVGEMLARRQGDTEEYRLNERLEKFTATRPI